MSVAEFLADEVELADERTLHRILLAASRWCDEYLGYPLAAHHHVERTRMRPDREGRLVWHPRHRPFISLESLTCDRTIYAAPDVSLLDERAVIVDLTRMATSWTGALQFGIPTMELNTVWRYFAGYRTLPPAVRDATSLRAMSLLTDDKSQDFLSDAKCLLDPLR